MTGSDLYKKGDLTGAIQAQLAEVRANPTDHGRRLFLVELCVFAGDLERARKQLDILKFDNPEQELALTNTKLLLQGEQARRDLFTLGKAPMFFSEQPSHVGLRSQAVQKLREKDAKAAAELIAQADAEVPTCLGSLNDKPYVGLRDCDDVFGPVLEVVAKGNYFWVPLEQVASIACSPPRFPRDLIWLPARLDLLDGSSGEVFLPGIYQDSHTSIDQLKLGRSTDFTESSPVRGRGAKLFLVGEDAVPVYEWRDLHV